MQNVQLMGGIPMRLEWLEDIVAVAETGSFSEAAERRRLTQSAFSRRIQNIEDYVGVELFDRTRKPVHLRATTQAQRDQILSLVASLRQLVAELRRGDRISNNKFVLASQHSLTAALTPAILGRIWLRREDIYIRLRSANLDQCFAQLLSRQADMALVYRLPGEKHPIRGDYIETQTIGRDRLIPVIAAGEKVWLDKLLAEGEVTYIAYPADVFLGQVMERRVLAQMRGRLRAVPKVETALTLAAIEMAAVGLGVAWVPKSLARDRLASKRLLDLSDVLPNCAMDVTAVRLVGNSGPIDLWVWSQLAAMTGDGAADGWPGDSPS